MATASLLVPVDLPPLGVVFLVLVCCEGCEAVLCEGCGGVICGGVLCKGCGWRVGEGVGCVEGRRERRM